MYKKGAKVIILTMFIAVSIVVLGIYQINSINWDYLEESYMSEKENAIEYYFEHLSDDMMAGVVFNAYRNETVEALNNRDIQWLEENVSKHIIESDLSDINYILIANEDLSFIEEVGPSLKKELLAMDVVKNSIYENEVSIFFTEINNRYALIISTPMMDSNHKSPTGVYVAVSYFNKENYNNIKELLGAKEVSNIHLRNNVNNIKEEFNKKYKTISTEVQVLNSDYYLRVVYEVDYLFYIFVLQRNRILTLGILGSLIACIFLLLSLRRISNKIINITKQVKEIAEGDCSVSIKEEKCYFEEINDLSKNINKMSEDIRNHRTTINNNYLEMTDVIVNAVEINDSYTSQHNRSVGIYAKIIAEEIGYSSIEDIEMAAKLHDMGKISIPGTILNKPGKLTESEYEVIKTHPSEGYKIIENIEYFSNIKLGVKHHHERWDGSGYPDGLKADDIPLIALIISIADVYDALTSDRSYRKAMPHEEAIKIITENSGKMFDPLLVQALINREEDFKNCLLKMRRG